MSEYDEQEIIKFGQAKYNMGYNMGYNVGYTAGIISGVLLGSICLLTVTIVKQVQLR
jgi:hypothetical protein